MFTIVISEKGGLERREAFERGEISVGRVQGNDLMLAKGNVSKHHARLLFREGRFIVTDLKSTNGTYVNGRKISQATTVREGDKIYIGDFVLRVEATSSDAPRALEAAGARPPLIHPDSGSPPSRSPSTPDVSSSASVAPAPTGPHRSLDLASVSHYPLERDPDSESAPELGGAEMPPLPAPPRLPQSLDLQPPSQPRPRVTSAVAAPERASAPARAPLASAVASVAIGSASAAPPRPAAAWSGPVSRAAASASPPLGAAPVRSQVPDLPRVSLREGPQQAALRVALVTLVARLAAADETAATADEASSSLGPDATRLGLEIKAREQARAMRAEGEVPEGVDLELVIRDAVRELIDLGPLGPWLDDDQVSELHVVRPDHVVAVKNGQPVRVEPGFTGDQAVARVVARLAARSGMPLERGETLVQRRLMAGALLVAVGPPTVPGWVVTIRKPRRVEASLDEMVRGGALSRSMAAFLQAGMAARANVLVIGSGPGVAARVLAALVALSVPGERVASITDEDELVVSHAGVVPFLADRGRSLHEALAAAMRWGPDRLALTSLVGSTAATTIDAIASGAEGVLAALSAPSMRQGLARLVTQVAMARPGTSIEVTREAVGQSFDIAVEVATASTDARLRFRRVTELCGADGAGIATRDLFLHNPDGMSDAAFVATGASPRLATEFTARGIHLDPALFKRAR